MRLAHLLTLMSNCTETCVPCLCSNTHPFLFQSGKALEFSKSFKSFLGMYISKNFCLQASNIVFGITQFATHLIWIINQLVLAPT